MAALGKSLTAPVWVDVCGLSELIPGAGVCARVAGEHVAVFYLPGEKNRQLYALDNVDPFSGASVLARGIVGDIDGELVVASPVYKQHFALATGRCLEDSDTALHTYPVRLSGERVEVASREVLR